MSVRENRWSRRKVLGHGWCGVSQKCRLAAAVRIKVSTKEMSNLRNVWVLRRRSVGVDHGDDVRTWAWVSRNGINGGSGSVWMEAFMSVVFGTRVAS